jgi:hypothetical protein
MKINKAFVCDDPGDVMALVDTWTWIVGSLDTSSYIDEKTVWGLMIIGSMVAESVRAMINKLSPGYFDEDEKEEA